MWALGYPEQALKRGEAAIELSEALSHPPSLAFALGVVCYFHQYRREAQTARGFAERLIALSAEQGFAHWLAQGRIAHGWASAALGRHEEGIAELREGLGGFRAIGVEVLRPHGLCLLAEACMEAGLGDDSLRALSEALEAAKEYDIRHCESEIHRLKGEWLLRRDNSSIEEAEGCFQHAIEIAKQQSARSFELRATISLARMLRDAGCRDKTRAVLTRVYNWFTEGFGTADLKEARALIEDLAA
jgi:predicted ATPase